MPAISQDEKQQRRRAVRSVIGTHVMEGLEPDATTRSIMNRYAEGELTLEEFSAEMQRHAQTVMQSLGG